MSYHSTTFDPPDLLPTGHVDYPAVALVREVDGEGHGPQQCCGDVADCTAWSDSGVQPPEQFEVAFV
ncbi:hypothetical protein SAMN04487917_102322 [Arthrobacter sp. yr096]|nr:hypothetical protein SAMN04487917_102322 [Arthrobacter sp. yr096]